MSLKIGRALALTVTLLCHTSHGWVRFPAPRFFTHLRASPEAQPGAVVTTSTQTCTTTEGETTKTVITTITTIVTVAPQAQQTLENQGVEVKDSDRAIIAPKPSAAASAEDPMAQMMAMMAMSQGLDDGENTPNPRYSS